MTWAELRGHVAPVLGKVVGADDLVDQLRPCWIFASSVSRAREEVQAQWPEPALGAAKLGGLPDLPEPAIWPTTSRGEPMDFLMQVRLDDGPALPGLPSTGSILFFSGFDDPSENIQHKLIYVEEGTLRVRTQRPDGPRFEYSQDYKPLPIRWTPSFQIPRNGRYFDVIDGEGNANEVAASELQNELHAAAFAYSGVALQRYEAITTLGWLARERQLGGAHRG